MTAVVGKRLSFWNGMSPKRVLFIFIFAPWCLWEVVQWGIGLAGPYGKFEPFDAGLAALGLGVGYYAYLLFRDSQDTFVIASPCPTCAKESQRNFHGPEADKTWMTPCGACVAYLRITRETLAIEEESIDALDETASTYKVVGDQYETLVPRDDDLWKSFRFAIPPTCAMCSSPETTQQRAARIDGYSPAPRGLTGALTWKSQGNAVHHPSHGEYLDKAMTKLAVHVCEKHAAKDSPDPLVSSYGVLSFVSYRYYKAFCELNQMAGPEGAMALVAAAERARAVDAGRHHDDHRVHGRKPGS